MKEIVRERGRIAFNSSFILSHLARNCGASENTKNPASCVSHKRPGKVGKAVDFTARITEVEGD